MLRRVLLWGIGLAVAALLVAPFGLDFYHRYEFQRELAALANPAGRAALTERYGSMAALGDELARRCRQIYGQEEPHCLRYRPQPGR